MKSLLMALFVLCANQSFAETKVPQIFEINSEISMQMNSLLQGRGKDTGLVAKLFATKLDPQRPIILRLNSPGGSLSGVSDVADYFDNNCDRTKGCKLITQVTATDKCSSACTILLFRGDEIRIARGSTLGLHAAATTSGFLSEAIKVMPPEFMMSVYYSLGVNAQCIMDLQETQATFSQLAPTYVTGEEFASCIDGDAAQSKVKLL